MKKLFIIIFLLVSTCAAYAQTTVTCPTCSGNGAIVCPMCAGNGVTYTMFGVSPCFGCGGARFIPCGVCFGSGSVTYTMPPVYNGGTYGGSLYDDSSSFSSSSGSKCTRCNGTGHCKSCGGAGRKVDWGPNSVISKDKYDQKCGVCNGSGRCGVCDGKGYY